ncbi:MAG: flagellar biosynthetic protein FliO [Ruminiclostridium sp.]|nr:flagellar biosynthetic protein FliO [Ruminiclostridium sp.]
MNIKIYFEVILFLLGFGALLFLTYVTTRYIAGKSSKAMKGRHLSIIETISLGTDKRIHLVKAGEKHILIASTSKSIEFLTDLSISEEESSNNNSVHETQNIFDFKSIFEKYMNIYKNKKNVIFKPETDMSANNSGGERFKFNLEKLKHITQKINTQIGKDRDGDTDEK